MIISFWTPAPKSPTEKSLDTSLEYLDHSTYWPVVPFSVNFQKNKVSFPEDFSFTRTCFSYLQCLEKLISSSGPKFVSYMLLPLPSLQLYLPGAEKVPGGGMMILVSLQIDKLVIMAKNFVN